MKKIILVAVAATALAAPVQAASNHAAPDHADTPGTAASTYIADRPASSAHSHRKTTAFILRDRRPAEVAALPSVRP
jgi:hypothetical protein